MTTEGPLYTIFTDGSSDNKYDTGPKAAIGAAAVLCVDGVPVSAVAAGARTGTNNIAEMLGVYLAFEGVIPTQTYWLCDKHGETPDASCCDPQSYGVNKKMRPIWEDAKIYSDSQYVVKGMNEWMWGWIANNWKKINDGEPVANKAQWLALSKARRGTGADLVHVKGHNGILGNELADRIAGAVREAIPVFLQAPYAQTALIHLGQDTLNGIDVKTNEWLPHSIDAVADQISNTNDLTWSNSFFSKS